MKNANVNFAKTIAAIYMKDIVQRCQESGRTQPNFVWGLSARPPRKHRSVDVRGVLQMGVTVQHLVPHAPMRCRGEILGWWFWAH